MKVSETQQLVSELLQKGGFSFESVEIEDKGEGEFYINIVSQKDAVHLIGRNGEVLLSLQHLLKNILRNSGMTEENEYVKIDIDSYRTKQEANVLAMADKRAQLVLETGRTEVLPSMSAFFRRIVHLHIKEQYPQLTTYSQGDGNYRSVCIALTSGEADEQAPSPDLYVDIDF
jgi:predicted RNA-binding protein Jag